MVSTVSDTYFEYCANDTDTIILTMDRVPIKQFDKQALSERRRKQNADDRRALRSKAMNDTRNLGARFGCVVALTPDTGGSASLSPIDTIKEWSAAIDAGDLGWNVDAMSIMLKAVLDMGIMHEASYSLIRCMFDGTTLTDELRLSIIIRCPMVYEFCLAAIEDEKMMLAFAASNAIASLVCSTMCAVHAWGHPSNIFPRILTIIETRPRYKQSSTLMMCIGEAIGQYIDVGIAGFMLPRMLTMSAAIDLADAYTPVQALHAIACCVEGLVTSCGISPIMDIVRHGVMIAMQHPWVGKSELLDGVLYIFDEISQITGPDACSTLVNGGAFRVLEPAMGTHTSVCIMITRNILMEKSASSMDCLMLHTSLLKAIIQCAYTINGSDASFYALDCLVMCLQFQEHVCALVGMGALDAMCKARLHYPHNVDYEHAIEQCYKVMPHIKVAYESVATMPYQMERH